SLVPSERSRFSQLPIRIGRHPLNDFSPPHPLISAFHARIEDNNGKLWLRDSGSKIGVFVTGPAGTAIRVDAQTGYVLALAGYRFYLSPDVVVHLEFVEAAAPIRHSTTQGRVLGNPAMLVPGSPAAPAGVMPPGGSVTP